MWKKTIIAVTLAAFLNITLGCTHTVKTAPEKMKKPTERIIKIALITGQIVTFISPGGQFDCSTNQISGFIFSSEARTDEGTAHRRIERPYTISADSVMTAWVQRSNSALTILALLVVAGALVALIVAASEDDTAPPPSDSGGTESCPFVYSFDGTQYILDAEPLGGAICRALQRSEYSKLEHISNVNDNYRLKFRNETSETQHLDQVQLLVVDHDPDQAAVPDVYGKMHLVRQMVRPSKAADEIGRTILPFVIEDDGMPWQTILTESELLSASDSRHHLIVEFPKPTDAATAHLVYNAGTAVWGSHMIREMVEARGSGIDSWYESLNQFGTVFLRLIKFNVDEELYILKINVMKGSLSTERGRIYGGGPFATENRFASFDVSDIAGDKLTLNLNPPKGFWTLDYLAVQYDHDSTVTPLNCRILDGIDQDGQSIVSAISEEDGVYHEMPLIGDFVDFAFDVPVLPSDVARSVFLHTTGYYELHMNKELPEKQKLIDSILQNPGSIASYSTKKYLETYRRLMRTQIRP